MDIVGTGMIAVGIVFVLLLGEIDLSVGSVSGLAAAVFAVLNVNHGMPEWLAVIVAVLVGAAIGAVQGFFFARIGVPAFVVTLAGLLAWNGLMLYVLGAERHHQPSRGRAGRHADQLLLPRRGRRRTAWRRSARPRTSSSSYRDRRPPQGRRDAVPAAAARSGAHRRCSRWSRSPPPTC